MRKFEEFKARQKFKEEVRKQRQREASASPKPAPKMPKYAGVKPADEKKKTQVIKRPVRRAQKVTNDNGPSVSQPFEDQEDAQEEETKGERLPTILNDCNFKISPQSRQHAFGEGPGVSVTDFDPESNAEA